MQSHKRVRQLNSDEVKEIMDIRDKSGNYEIKCGCCILLGAVEEFKNYFEKLNKEQHQAFIHYPIIDLLPPNTLS